LGGVPIRSRLFGMSSGTGSRTVPLRVRVGVRGVLQGDLFCPGRRQSAVQRHPALASGGSVQTGFVENQVLSDQPVLMGLQGLARTMVAYFRRGLFWTTTNLIPCLCAKLARL